MRARGQGGPVTDEAIIAALQAAHRSASEAVSLLHERWDRQRAAHSAEIDRTEAILFGVGKCPWLLREALGMFDVTPDGHALLRAATRAGDDVPVAEQTGEVSE